MIKQFLAILVMVCMGLVAWAQQVVLSGTQSGNRFLSKDTCYLLSGNYEVPSPYTLEIEEGTLIMGEKSTLGTLVVERGATLLAVGTANEPIIFTTDQTGSNKAPGDWGGIVIGGYAPNNDALNTVDVYRNTVQYFGGGNVSADNSGILQYARIEFAGGGAAPDNSDQCGLVLLSVGTGTTIDHVQTSYSAMGGFVNKGGTVNAHHLVSYDDQEVHFRFIDGNVSKMQFLLGLRMGASAHTSLNYASNGVVIENNGAGTSTILLTNPAISNMTLLARGYCELSMHTDIENGILIDNRGAGDIWNSAVAGYQNYGLYIPSTASVALTNSNDLNFSFNSMKDNFSPQYGSLTWSGGCSSSMQDWIEGLTALGCEELSNDLFPASLGYTESLCGDYCETRPTLTYSGSDLDGTDFSGIFSNTFFDNTTTTRGAIQSSDWTATWASFCAADYVCPSTRSSTLVAITAQLQFVPNPANRTTNLLFDAATTGKAQILVMDKISGRVLHATTVNIHELGAQRIALELPGLAENVYTVQLRLNGQVCYGKLSVQ